MVYIPPFVVTIVQYGLWEGDSQVVMFLLKSYGILSVKAWTVTWQKCMDSGIFILRLKSRSSGKSLNLFESQFPNL